MPSTPSSQYSPPPNSTAPAQTAPPPPGPPPAWTPAPAAPLAPRPLSWPRWLDYGVVVIGIGTLLMFIGFLFGDGFASQLGTGGNANTAQGDLEAFFVLAGVGILLVIGGWLYRVVMAARAGMR